MAASTVKPRIKLDKKEAKQGEIIEVTTEKAGARRRRSRGE